MENGQDNPSKAVKDESTDTAGLEKLKSARSSAKGNLTRSSNELSDLITQNSEPGVVREKLDVCEKKFASFEECHLDFHATLVDKTAVQDSQSYFADVQDGFNKLVTTVMGYIRGREEKLQSAVNPEDSVSSSGSSRHSVRSALVKAKAKRAALKTKADALEKLHVLNQAKMDLDYKQKQLELETEAKCVEAEESVYRKELDDVSLAAPDTKDRCLTPPQPRWSPNPLAPEYIPKPHADGSLHELIEQQQQQQQAMVDIFQLPKAELPTFDGDPLKYYQFIRAFDNMVDRAHADASAKLTRLVQYCTGKAKRVIECCLVMPPEAGYARARALLSERFGDSYAISEAWIKSITQGSPLNANDSSALQDLADDMKSCSETLMAMGLLSEVDTQKSMVQIVQRLPVYLQTRWRRDAVSFKKQWGKYPSFWALVQFVQRAADEANDPVFGLPEPKRQPERTRKSGSSFGAVVLAESQTADNKETVKDAGMSSLKDTSKPRVCPMCQQEHTLFSCDDFRKMKPEERLKFTRNKRLCDNCLLPNHLAYRCRRPTVCTVSGCGKKHSRFLHISRKTQAESNDSHNREKAPETSDPTNTVGTSGYVDATDASKAKTVLPIVPVKVKAKDGGLSHVTYALLDGGSTNTFCSEALLHDLALEGSPSSLSLTTLDGQSKTATSVVSLEVMGLDDGSRYSVNLPHVYSKAKLPIPTECMPSQGEIDKWPHLKGIKLPEKGDLRVDLLIGQDVPEALVPRDVRKGKRNEPYAVKSILGWTLNGPFRLGDSHRAVANFVSANEQLDNRLEKFWRIDSSDVFNDDLPQMSKEDRRALEIIENSLEKVDGHYQTAIPFKNAPIKMPNNRVVAEGRLESLKRRLKKDSGLHAKYKQGINDLVAKGYAEQVEDYDSSEDPVWFIPHHPVISAAKPDKVRIVFDCGSKYHGTSLNDQVLQGPDLTNSLLGVLLRFREGSVAIMGDIEAMYHQVRVKPTHRDVLRFLWWKDGDPDQNVIELRMSAHLFGGVWSACTANFALRKTAEDNEDDFDATTIETVRRNFYVDDCLRSLDFPSEAVRMVDQLRHLLARGGFNIVKWLSNVRVVMATIPVASRAPTLKDLDFEKDTLPTERALGLKWNVESDNFELAVKVIQRPLTRRGVVSVVCSIYDPLGFVAPLVFPAKELFQEMTRLKIGWDDPVPKELADRWNKWRDSILKLEAVKVPRCIKPGPFRDPSSIQLHHFADASQIGYGAVSYLRLTNPEGNIHCAFLMSKVRLAPLKTLTIPRLELSAAVVAAKLDRTLRKELPLTMARSFFWTDSMIVLQYITNEDKRFHTFVANRVARIHEASDPSQWLHVKSEDNPADMVSRGLTFEEFMKHERTWFQGPGFLHEPESAWLEKAPEVPIIINDDPEIKRDGKQRVFVTVETTRPVLDDFIEGYSSWSALKKGAAWLLRLKTILLCKAQKKPVPEFENRLTVDEMVRAEDALILYVQRKTFKSTFEALSSREGRVKSSDPLRNLVPAMDRSGLLCVGGRLENAPIHHRMKRQMILPKEHHIVTLIVRHFHQVSAHGGLDYVISLTRERFWIVGARVAVKRVLRACIPCKRLHSRPIQQFMADLPEDRLKPFEPAFTFVGVDCFGPFRVKRARSMVKRYGCIFTCLVTRAIHIEVLHSLDAHSFLNGLHRFMARRGQPKVIRSDNGTNFTAADKELRKAMAEWNKSSVLDVLLQKGVTWKFNPPTASHMGGVWERQIRTVRKALHSLREEQTMDDECFSTLMCQAEAVVNGRPITSQSDDPRDCEALTPNHLLLLKPGSTLPPGVFTKEDIFRRHWKQAQYLANVFWRRWLKEYLPTLQHRRKWTQPGPQIEIGNLVLVTDENTPRGLWPLGRIVDTYPGKDGLVRSVQVRTKSTLLTRPVHKLCLLESV